MNIDCLASGKCPPLLVSSFVCTAENYDSNQDELKGVGAHVRASLMDIFNNGSWSDLHDDVEDIADLHSSNDDGKDMADLDSSVLFLDS
jgi:hypothetical protein